MHKIFKLCGSPSEEYWKRTKLPHATSFKPQRPYKRQITDTFKNFSSATLALIDKLLSIEPQDRGSASIALKSEVTSVILKSFFYHYIEVIKFDSNLFVRSNFGILITLLLFMLEKILVLHHKSPTL